MSEMNPHESSARDSAVPDPAKPGAGDIRWKQVAGGFAIAFGVMFGIRIVLWIVIALTLAGAQDYGGLVASLVAWYVPIPVLLFLIWRTARRGLKSRAIGMAIYAGLAALLVTGCWAAVSA